MHHHKSVSTNKLGLISHDTELEGIKKSLVLKVLKKHMEILVHLLSKSCYRSRKQNNHTDHKVKTFLSNYSLIKS